MVDAAVVGRRGDFSRTRGSAAGHTAELTNKSHAQNFVNVHTKGDHSRMC